MAVIVLAVALLALFAPQTCLWIGLSWIDPLLMLVMFGMGLTLRPQDLLMVFRRPRDILLGCAAQFTVMPLLALALARLFGLNEALTVGVILVGTCPGGTASNVMTYLSRDDVALSVGMTSLNTLLAPILTPLITSLLLRATVAVDVAAMVLSILKVVITPLALGFIINRVWGEHTARIAGALPLVSVAAISMILASVVSHNAELILSVTPAVYAVVILHNLLGYAAGYLIAAALHLPMSRKKALSIEVGMQNSGLSVSLARSAFPAMAMATVPGALFSVWHNFSGAMMAGLLRRLKGPGDEQP